MKKLNYINLIDKSKENNFLNFITLIQNLKNKRFNSRLNLYNSRIIRN